jgi:hypothetical protein
VSADGFDDVVVGASLYDGGHTDEGRVHVYLGSASGLAASPVWTAESDQASASFGASVGSAGDMNGDGRDDVIVGAPLYDGGQTDEGRAVVYLGSTSGVESTVFWAAESDQASAQLGVSVASAGAVNGDCFADVIAGANLYDAGQTDEGRAFVYYGAAEDVTSPAPWSARSDQESAQLGYSVASAGDVNGDGYDDVIVGANLYDNGETNEGRAFLYLGSAGGVGAVAAWTAESDQASAGFGFSVASAGDVNADGYDDVVVGAVGFDGGNTNEGRAHLYLGSAGGLGASAAWTGESDQDFGNFGYSVASAGDVNDDGYADVIVGAPYATNGQSNEGRAFVFLGSASGLAASAVWIGESNQALSEYGYVVASAGDVNADGRDDVIVGAPRYTNGQSQEGRAYLYLGSSSGVTSSAAWTAESDQASALFGQSVAGAGDVNGDGRHDVLVGAPDYDNGQANEGRASLYLGSGTAVATTAAWTLELDQANVQLGQSVASAGDVDGDGYADVIVGAYNHDDGWTDRGRAQVHLGSAYGVAATPFWIGTADGNTTRYGFAVASAGDIAGTGRDAVIVGAYALDGAETDEGYAFVYDVRYSRGGDDDGDGVCNRDDVCDGADDAVDGDGDGVADGCDPCPVDNPDDGDGDGICDSDPKPLTVGWQYEVTAFTPDAIAIGDVHAASGRELVIVSEGTPWYEPDPASGTGKVIVLKSDGTSFPGGGAFLPAPGRDIMGFPLIEDLYGDGMAELLVGEFQGEAASGTTFALAMAGNDVTGVWEHAPRGYPGLWNMGASAGDVNGDGSRELVIPSWDGVVAVVEPGSGATTTSFDVFAAYGERLYGHAAIADVDGGGWDEIVVAGAVTGRVIALSVDGGGNLVPVFVGDPLPGGRRVVGSGPAVGDLDGDGEPEMVVAATDASPAAVYAYSYGHGDGCKYAWEATGGGDYYWTSPVIGDVDAAVGGDAEVVVMSNDGVLSVLGATAEVPGACAAGAVVRAQPIGGGGSAWFTPALADLTGGSGLDVVAATYTTIEVIDVEADGDVAFERIEASATFYPSAVVEAGPGGGAEGARIYVSGWLDGKVHQLLTPANSKVPADEWLTFMGGNMRTGARTGAPWGRGHGSSPVAGPARVSTLAQPGPAGDAEGMQRYGTMAGAPGAGAAARRSRALIDPGPGGHGGGADRPDPRHMPR